MGLGRQVIKFIRLNGPDPVAEIGTTEIPHVQMNLVGKVSDGRRLEPITTPHQSMNLVAFFQKQFCEVGAVLASDAGDESLAEQGKLKVEGRELRGGGSLNLGIYGAHERGNLMPCFISRN
jgi:hypothetical protein